jgi:branched-chain amino acid transport system permease protein
MEYLYHLLILLSIYVILTQSYNLCFGLAGFLHLAHVGVYAIGAYTCALMAVNLGLSFPVCVLGALISSGLAGFVVYFLSRRLGTDYFAIGTLALAGIVTSILINWRSVTRGVLGIPGIPRPAVFGIEVVSTIDFLMLSSTMAFLTLLLLRVFFSGRFKRELVAQAEFPQSAMALGRNVELQRCTAFVAASLCAGIAGSLFAYYISYIDPSSFSLSEMILILSMTVLGRPRAFWGCLLATAFLIALPEALRFVDIPSSYLGPARQFLYAFILFIVVYLRRAVLFPALRSV